MAEERGSAAELQRRKRRSKNKRKSRKHERLMYSLKWALGGLAVGLPLLVLLLYAVARV